MNQPVAQILLTRNDIADRTQYLNAQNTFHELLHMGVIPIVNENDTLAVTEIKFGDNDTLSAITAGMVQADYLFLMTDVDCLYDKNPRTNPDAKPIEVVEDIADLVADVSSAGSSLGTGGMSTKIVAARLATSAGVTTVITRSSKPGNIAAIVKYAEAQKALQASLASSQHSLGDTTMPDSTTQLAEKAATPALSSSTDAASAPAAATMTTQGDILDPASGLTAPLHTRFLPQDHAIRDRYFWLLHGLAPHGNLYIDEGAYRALADKAGLLPVGIVDCDGHFHQQEAVRLVVVKRSPSSTDSKRASASADTLASGFEKEDPAPVEVGRAVVNYSAAEIKRIRGLKSTEIHNVLGYADSEYVAFRENVAFFRVERSRPTTPGLPADAA
ncbi:Aspartate/glutamate/uridylate kinase [Macrophomina phaseolina MS6]|uniref:Aspartate/glutamate/uridylate kinase n=1 Tax=Macrophomina phaseolina (strain MS6) TaxID=1126212 RepID=K2S3W1_MACPH|nr:Aspartate/glutamate/uridylate kinase [Macrophomina phaseolina MS6]